MTTAAPTTAPTAPGLDRKQVDFLYWHAVSKMRMADFEGANAIFRLLHAALPDRVDAALGRVYCLMRQGEFDDASGLVAQLRRRLLQAEEMALLGRLHRRCEFERARAGARLRALSRRGATGMAGVGVGAAVAMPHTLGDDTMARRAAEQTPRPTPGT